MKPFQASLSSGRTCVSPTGSAARRLQANYPARHANTAAAVVEPHTKATAKALSAPCNQLWPKKTKKTRGPPNQLAISTTTTHRWQQDLVVSSERQAMPSNVAGLGWNHTDTFQTARQHRGSRQSGRLFRGSGSCRYDWIGQQCHRNFPVSVSCSASYEYCVASCFHPVSLFTVSVFSFFFSCPVCFLLQD